MNIKRLLFGCLFLASCVLSVAQEQRVKEEGKTLFNPHWFMQLQGGVAHTVGETAFSDLLSPAGALNVGYQFSPVWGVRAGVSGWQAKGCWAANTDVYKYKHLQGSVDLLADLSAWLCGFNPERTFNGYAFAGVGLNHAFDNDEANALSTNGYTLEYLWSGSKNLVAGRFGLGCNLRLNDRLSINVEGNANFLSDKFNSKKAGNSDWQLNALVGFSIRLGKGYKKTAPIYYEPEPVAPVAPAPVQEVVKEEPKTLAAPEQPVKAEPIKIDVFFALNSALVQNDQRDKLNELADYLKQHPDAEVALTGYADVETGNPRINMALSEKRAHNVATILRNLGVAPERLHADFKGDAVQPYDTPQKNRVVVCIVE